MVEDMDEASAYGSSMYRLIDEAIHAEPFESEESELSDSARGETPPTADEARSEAQLPKFESVLSEQTAEKRATGGETDVFTDSIGFDSAWELYRRGEMGAGGVLAVLTRIHGTMPGASWPLVVSALPSDEVRLSFIYFSRMHAQNTVFDRGLELWYRLEMLIIFSSSPIFHRLTAPSRVFHIDICRARR